MPQNAFGWLMLA